MRFPRPGVAAAGLALLLTAGVQAQSIDAGRKAYQECVACHAIEKGVNGVGPSLAGIVGTKAGEVDGFRFSGPMKRSGIVWTTENLDKTWPTRRPSSPVRACPIRACRTRRCEPM